MTVHAAQDARSKHRKPPKNRGHEFRPDQAAPAPSTVHPLPTLDAAGLQGYEPTRPQAVPHRCMRNPWPGGTAGALVKMREAIGGFNKKKIKGVPKGLCSGTPEKP